jgi:hypothetical protein
MFVGQDAKDDDNKHRLVINAIEGQSPYRSAIDILAVTFLPMAEPSYVGCDSTPPIVERCRLAGGKTADSVDNKPVLVIVVFSR